MLIISVLASTVIGYRRPFASFAFAFAFALALCPLCWSHFEIYHQRPD